MKERTSASFPSRGLKEIFRHWQNSPSTTNSMSITTSRWSHLSSQTHHFLWDTGLSPWDNTTSEGQTCSFVGCLLERSKFQSHSCLWLVNQRASDVLIKTIDQPSRYFFLCSQATCKSAHQIFWAIVALSHFEQWMSEDEWVKTMNEWV